MNPEMPQKPQDELESSLTALLLGELPHERAAALHQRLAQDAELAKLYERLKHTISLVRETAASPAVETAAPPVVLKLSKTRRQMLLQHFKSVAPKEFIRPRRRASPWLAPVGIAAALVAIVGGLSLPIWSRTKSKGQSLASHTWSLAESAAPVLHIQDLNGGLDQIAAGAQDIRGGTPAALSLPAAPPPAKPTGTAIVLPKVTELAEATTPTTPIGGAVALSAGTTLRAFYDDSSGRAIGGRGGGFGGGGFGGATSSSSPNSLGAAQRQYPNDRTAGDAYFSTDPETRRVVTTRAQNNDQNALVGQNEANRSAGIFAPDGKPLLSTPQNGEVAAFRRRYGLAPGGSRGTSEATSPATAPTPAPAPAEPALVGQSLEVARVPLQTSGADKTAGDLVAGLKGVVTGKPATEVRNAGELNQAPASEPTRSASSSYYGGGAYGGYSTISKLSEGETVAGTVHINGVGDVPVTGPQSRSEGQTAGVTQAGRNIIIDAFNASKSYTEGVTQGKGVLFIEGPAAAPRELVPLAIKLPAPAFKGMPKDVPVLGDAPTAGGLFRRRPEAARTIEPSTTERYTHDRLLSQLGTVPSGFEVGTNFTDTSRMLGSMYSSDVDMLWLQPSSTNLTPQTPVTINLNVAKLQQPVIGIDAYNNFDSRFFVASNLSVGQGAASKQGESAPAFKGSPGDMPQLGDVAEVGRLFRPKAADGEHRPEAQPIASAVQLQVAEKDKSTYLGLKEELGRRTNAGTMESLNSFQIAIGDSRDDTSALQEPSRKKAPAREPEVAGESRRTKASPIILPTADAETGLGWKDSAADQQRGQLADAKAALGEAQRSRQLLDIKMASQGIDAALPEPHMVEIAGKAESQPAQSPAPEERFAKQEQKVREAQKKVDDLQAKLQISDAASRGEGLSPGLTTEWVRKLGRLWSEMKAELIRQQAELKRLQEPGHVERTERLTSVALGFSNRLDNLEREANSIELGRVDQIPPYVEAKHALEELQHFLSGIEKGETRKPDQTTQPDTAPPKATAPAPIPQPEVQTADNAFSTFSLNVSDVSFKLAAASLEKGAMPEPATMRSEEFINAFDYHDPEPPPGVPVAFAWERAQDPFAQNRDLLRFSVKTAALGRQPGRPLNIVLLLDTSGSMERADRVRIIHEALRVLAGQLQPQDKLSVVTFARTAHLWVDGVPGNQAAQVAEQLSGLTPQGGTNLEDAMNLAYQTALRHYLANGVNRVVLLTDGAANLGNVDPEALKQKVEANRKQGIALDCFGIGWEGYNDDLLEVLSRNGDGRYAFLNSPEEVASEFAAKLAGALQVAASDVKVQVEFNPARVTAYRQIGYAKHQLTKEQFRDNTVNAAQIGAAEAGNALYAVEVNPAGTGPLCTVRVRFRIPGTADYREHAWDVPFTGNAVSLEQASPAMRLAATASAFSEWLASSPFASEVTTDRLLSYLSGVPEVYGADARPKKLEWMIRQAKSIAGK